MVYNQSGGVQKSWNEAMIPATVIPELFFFFVAFLVVTLPKWTFKPSALKDKNSVFLHVSIVLKKTFGKCLYFYACW